jgi:hypothetical protein
MRSPRPWRRRLSLSFMDLPHYRFAVLGTKTYRELAEEQGVPLDLALDLVSSLTSTRPSADDRVREDDEPIFPLLRLAATMLGPDALLRTTHVYVDALRRIADAEATLFEDFVVGLVREPAPGLSGSDRHGESVQRAQVTPLQELLILTHSWTWPATRGSSTSGATRPARASPPIWRAW